MAKIRLLSAAEQVAAHLRGELLRGTRGGMMAGVYPLAAELGVNHKTVRAALALLDREGVLVNRGPRRRRIFQMPADRTSVHPLRVAILESEPADRQVDYIVEIQHELAEAGHAPCFARKTQLDLGRDVGRIARLVQHTEADAWLVVAGSREVLGWFAAQAKPAFALFGRMRTVRIAGTGPAKGPAYAAAVRALVAHGHRRIVLLARPHRKLPVPGASERAFLSALEAEGIPVSDYNFPYWEYSKAGFHRCLEALFQVTPPTALVIQEAMLFAAVQQFLSRRRMLVPEQVSLVCADPDPTYEWRIPSVAHIQMNSAPWIRRVLRWAANVSRGEDDRRQVFTKAAFFEGGTIGPAVM